METQIAQQIDRAPHGLEKNKSEAQENPEAEFDISNDGTVEKPINREPPMDDLVHSFLTNVDNYDRNHGPIQHRLATDHIITIDGLVPKPMTISPDQLIGNYTQHKITCALQCAGNRRHSMRMRIKEVQGVDWFDAAVMNCVWEGPKLCDILATAGVRFSPTEDEVVNGSSGVPRPNHVQFASYGTKTQEDDWYGGSIPFNRATDPSMDVILAVKMNGNPLSTRHGFPVRTIVPGVLGARSVKWLDRITVSTEESPNFYQQHDYKILPPNAVDKESAEPYWRKIPPMLEMPVNACVAHPASESTVQLDQDGMIEVKGYAVPHGADGPVVRVQVSGDEGETWKDASLDDGGAELASKWSWVLWHCRIKVMRGSGRKIWARATDAGGNTQTLERSTWNLRGVAYNGYEAVYDLTVA